MTLCCPHLRDTQAGPTLHAPGETLPRHRHADAFVAIVLAGGYVEAGDTGRHRVDAGDTLLHQSWEGHIDRFDRRGARVLVVPVADDWNGPLCGRVADADHVARLAERDLPAAMALLAETVTAAPLRTEDWPDMLAMALRADPGLALAPWAESMGLHPGSLSRGFRQQFGLTPAAFRATARTHHALAALRRTDASLAAVALDCGFADQAHMTRAIGAMTGSSPRRLRGQPGGSSFAGLPKAAAKSPGVAPSSRCSPSAASPCAARATASEKEKCGG